MGTLSRIKKLADANHKTIKLAAEGWVKAFETNEHRVFLSFTSADSDDGYYVHFIHEQPADTEGVDGILVATALSDSFKMGPDKLCWKGPVWIYAAEAATGGLQCCEYGSGAGLLEI